jgi:hypothetical protein
MNHQRDCPRPQRGRRGELLLLALLVTACGPGNAQYTILDEGSGEPIVTHIRRTVGSRFLFGQMTTDGKVGALGEASYTGHVTLTDGPEVLVYGTLDGDVFLQYSGLDDALEFTWGDSTSLADAPVLSMRLPLKLGTRWRTFDAKGTPFYEYRVETVERVTVPAGTFDTARLTQLNLRAGTQVNRWFTNDVGLVQRNESLLFSYSLAPEAP